METQMFNMERLNSVVDNADAVTILVSTMYVQKEDNYSRLESWHLERLENKSCTYEELKQLRIPTTKEYSGVEYDINKITEFYNEENNVYEIMLWRTKKSDNDFVIVSGR